MLTGRCDRYKLRRERKRHVLLLDQAIAEQVHRTVLALVYLILIFEVGSALLAGWAALNFGTIVHSFDV